MRWPVLILSFAAACATDPGGPGPDPDDNVDDPTDDDQDGIRDTFERTLMERFGPELRLPPASVDWTRPANVEWYLPHMKMRFDHAGCPDDSENLLNAGTITFTNLSEQTHYTKSSGLGLCRHNDGAPDLRESKQRALEFFLQADGDRNAVHAGIPDERMTEWRAYIQVRPSTYVTQDGVAAAYDLQVWDFFPYNDNIWEANHEADWEHMTISISSDLAVVSVFYATHNEGFRVDDLTTLQWSGEHVVGYVADGSHATYATAGEHPGPVVPDNCYDGGPVWQTWTHFANLGQIGHILDGQTWATYGGRWGEVGETDFTSGPVGPMFNGKWDTAKEY